MVNLNDFTEIEEYAIAQAQQALCFAQEALSHKRVGASVIAKNRKGQLGNFGGCNIELATSDGLHAEVVALGNAIAAGYWQILEVVVTGTDEDQQAALCGGCLQKFMYTNPDCKILVIFPDGREKLRTTVRERNGPYAYMGKGKLYDSYEEHVSE